MVRKLELGLPINDPLIGGSEYRWAEVCPEVDEVLLRFARLKGVVVSEWLEDFPTRLVDWHKGGFDYSVSMITNYADPPKLFVYGAVCRDDEIGLVRKSVHLPELVLEGPVMRTVMARALVSLGKDLRLGSQVLSGEAVGFDISRVPLSPVPTRS